MSTLEGGGLGSEKGFTPVVTNPMSPSNPPGYSKEICDMGASAKGMSDLAGPVVFPFSSINHLRLFPQRASRHFLKFFFDGLSSAGLSAQTRLRS
jgi:hypothetical protein